MTIQFPWRVLERAHGVQQVRVAEYGLYLTWPWGYAFTLHAAARADNEEHALVVARALDAHMPGVWRGLVAYTDLADAYSEVWVRAWWQAMARADPETAAQYARCVSGWTNIDLRVVRKVAGVTTSRCLRYTDADLRELAEDLHAQTGIAWRVSGKTLVSGQMGHRPAGAGPTMDLVVRRHLDDWYGIEAFANASTDGWTEGAARLCLWGDVVREAKRLAGHE